MVYYAQLIKQANITPPPYNHFHGSDIDKVLNTNADSLYNTMFTDNQRTKIIPKTMEITSSVYAPAHDNDVEYNMFLLGSNRNYSYYDGYINDATDSYNLSTYFTPANTGSNQSNLVAKETAYSSGGTQNSACDWWLRSGMGPDSTGAMYVTSAGDVASKGIIYSLALRPAFVLNLA